MENSTIIRLTKKKWMLESTLKKFEGMFILFKNKTIAPEELTFRVTLFSSSGDKERLDFTVINKHVIQHELNAVLNDSTKITWTKNELDEILTGSDAYWLVETAASYVANAGYYNSTSNITLEEHLKKCMSDPEYEGGETYKKFCSTVKTFVGLVKKRVERKIKERMKNEKQCDM